MLSLCRKSPNIEWGGGSNPRIPLVTFVLNETRIDALDPIGKHHTVCALYVPYGVIRDFYLRNIEHVKRFCVNDLQQLVPVAQVDRATAS